MRQADRSCVHRATPGPTERYRSAPAQITATTLLLRIVQPGSASSPATTGCASSETSDDSLESRIELLCNLSNGRRLCPRGKRCGRIQGTIGITDARVRWPQPADSSSSRVPAQIRESPGRADPPASAESGCPPRLADGRPPKHATCFLGARTQLIGTCF